MQKITTTAAVCLALLPALATPAAAQNREHLQLAAELRMLQEQNQQLSLALNQLTETLKAVNSRLDTSDEFQRRRFADQEVLVKNLGSDLGTIRERTQDTDTRLRSLKDEIDALRQTFLSLPALLAQSQQSSLAPIDPNNPTAALAPPPDGPTPAGPPSAPNLPSRQMLGSRRIVSSIQRSATTPRRSTRPRSPGSSSCSRTSPPPNVPTTRSSSSASRSPT